MNTIKIGKLEIKAQDEPIKMTWHEASTKLTGGWRLPTKEELNLLYQQKSVLGGFALDFYWSSTEFSRGSAWGQNFANGNQFSLNKYNTDRVRAVRDCEINAGD